MVLTHNGSQLIIYTRRDGSFSLNVRAPSVRPLLLANPKYENEWREASTPKPGFLQEFLTVNHLRTDRHLQNVKSQLEQALHKHYFQYQNL